MRRCTVLENGIFFYMQMRIWTITRGGVDGLAQKQYSNETSSDYRTVFKSISNQFGCAQDGHQLL